MTDEEKGLSEIAVGNEAVMEKLQHAMNRKDSFHGNVHHLPTAQTAPLPEPPMESSSSKFNFLTIQDLFEQPDPEWMIENIIPEKSLTITFGASGSLKSFFMIDISLSLAYGLPWKGRETKQSGVIYIAGEGQHGIKKRIRAWQKHNGISREQDSAPFQLLPTPFSMGDIGRVIDFVSATVEAMPNVRMVVIDTLNRSLQGDENSAQDIGKFLTGCGVLQQALGVSIVIVHHSGKNAEKGMRGSSAIYASADTVIAIEKAGEKHIKVSCDKQKDSGEFQSFLLCHSEIETEFGTSLVLDAVAEGFKVEEEAEPKIPPQRLIMDTLRNHPNGITMTELMDKTGISKNTIYKYKNELEEAGVLVNRGTKNSGLYFYDGGNRPY